MSAGFHPLPCGCDSCRDRDADTVGTAMFAGLATGMVLVGLLQVARSFFPAVERLLS